MPFSGCVALMSMIPRVHVAPEIIKGYSILSSSVCPWSRVEYPGRSWPQSHQDLNYPALEFYVS